jgi:poly(3-hydroxybutyrate) depolymerase
VPEALASWADYNGCDPDALFEDPPGPLSTMRYEDCREGVGVRMIRIDGLRHQWARGEIDATAEMWSFFRDYSL